MEATNLVDIRAVLRYVILGEELIDHLLPSLACITLLTTQHRHDFRRCLGGGSDIEPGTIHMLTLRCENLHLVATLQLMAHWHQFVVHLGADAMTTYEGVDGEGKIESCASCRKGSDFSLRCEDEDFGSIEI